MTATSNQILTDFQDESETLVKEILTLLEECEGNFSQVKRLEKFGQIVDRIMGGAKSLISESGSKAAILQRIADVSGLCKAVGYKSSQIKEESFYLAAVAILFDATETLRDLIACLKTNAEPKPFAGTLVERLRWISSKFGDEYSDSVDVHSGKKQKMNQDDIDELMKKMGL